MHLWSVIWTASSLCTRLLSRAPHETSAAKAHHACLNYSLRSRVAAKIWVSLSTLPFATAQWPPRGPETCRERPPAVPSLPIPRAGAVFGVCRLTSFEQNKFPHSFILSPTAKQTDRPTRSVLPTHDTSHCLSINPKPKTCLVYTRFGIRDHKWQMPGIKLYLCLGWREMNRFDP